MSSILVMKLHRTNIHRKKEQSLSTQLSLNLFTVHEEHTRPEEIGPSRKSGTRRNKDRERVWIRRKTDEANGYNWDWEQLSSDGG